MKKLLATVLALNLILGGSAFAAPAATDTPEPSAVPEITETAEPSATPDVSAEPSATPGTSESPSASPEASAIPSPSPTAIAEPSATAKPPERELSKEFKLDIEVIKHKYIISKNAVIELYNDKDELLGSQLRYVGWDTPTLTMTFEVPEYRMGEYFKIKLVEGLRSIRYYNEMAQTGESIRVQTYGYLDEDGNYIQQNGAAITVNPHYDKEVHLYITNKWYNDMSPHARIVDGVLMAPVRGVAEAMGLDVNYNPEWDSATLSLEDQTAVFWADNEYMTYPGGDKNASHVPVYIEGSLFVPVRDLAEAFGCSLEVTDYGEFIDVLIGEAPYHQVIRNRIPVNRDGIGSKTNYLIWVSKREYKVRVYEGQQYHWKQLKEFPCALGAWNTPTVTGQFEILERTQWNYDGYYVGPVLRFYNGYALHSTLLYYGGGEYDGRVGVNISHGCVRLHPSDINWIAATVPFRTRVYITE